MMALPTIKLVKTTFLTMSHLARLTLLCRSSYGWQQSVTCCLSQSLVMYTGQGDDSQVWTTPMDKLLHRYYSTV